MNGNRIIKENANLDLVKLQRLATSDLSDLSANDMQDLTSLIDLLAKPEWGIELERLARLGETLNENETLNKDSENEIVHFHTALQNPNQEASLWQSFIDLIGDTWDMLWGDKKHNVDLSADEKNYIMYLARLAVKIQAYSELEKEQQAAYTISSLAKLGMILTVALSIAMVPVGLFSAFGTGVAILANLVLVGFATFSSATFGGIATYFRIKKTTQDRLQAEKVVNAKRKFLIEYNRVQRNKQIKNALDEINKRHRDVIDAQMQKGLLEALERDVDWEALLKALIKHLTDEKQKDINELLVALKEAYLHEGSPYINHATLDLARNTSGLKFWEYLDASQIIKIAIVGSGLAATIYGSLFGLSKVGLIASLLSLAGGPAATIVIAVLGTLLIAALVSSIIYIRFKKWQANQEIAYNQHRFKLQDDLSKRHKEVANVIKQTLESNERLDRDFFRIGFDTHDLHKELDALQNLLIAYQALAEEHVELKGQLDTLRQGIHTLQAAHTTLANEFKEQKSYSTQQMEELERKYKTLYGDYKTVKEDVGKKKEFFLQKAVEALNKQGVKNQKGASDNPPAQSPKPKSQ